MGRKFELRTHHHGVKYVFKQLNLNAIQIRCMELICEYDFDIKIIKGKENKVANEFNRKMHVMHITITTSTPGLWDRIKETNNTNELFQQVDACLQQQGTTYKFQHYKLEDGILKYKNKVYISNLENVKKLVLKEMHDVPYASHYG